MCKKPRKKHLDRKDVRIERLLSGCFLSGLLALVAFVPVPSAWVLAEPRQESHPAAVSQTTGAPDIGEPVAHVQCEPGYSATLYASGLRSPDGLAFSPAGVLHVVEEGANRVSRIEPDGSLTPVLGDLNSPEGLTFDGAGNMYVVEDARNGRLLQRAPDGQIIILATGLQAPEGVAVHPTEAGRSATAVYTTESNIQFVRSPYDLLTGVAAVMSPGEITHVITHTPTLNGSTIAFWSYAGLIAGPDGRLYVTNELSGQEITREVVVIPDVLTYTATLLTNDSIFAIDPVQGTRTLVASGLSAPEGLRFSADGSFPLYVAEENTGYQGRVSRVERDGRRTTVCSGLRGAEDVTVDADGRLYVSEDKSGFVIRIEVSEKAGSASSTPPPAPQPTTLPTRAPGAGLPNDGLLRGLWKQIVAFLRQIAALFLEISRNLFELHSLASGKLDLDQHAGIPVALSEKRGISTG